MNPSWDFHNLLPMVRATLANLEAAGDTDADDLAALLSEEVPELDALVLRIVRARQEALANESAVYKRIDDLNTRRQRYGRQAEALRSLLFSILQTLGLPKWRHAEVSISLSPGRPGVVITDEAALPDDLVRVKREPDKAAIRARLEAGETVAGAELRNTMPIMRILTK